MSRPPDYLPTSLIDQPVSQLACKHIMIHHIVIHGDFGSGLGVGVGGGKGADGGGEEPSPGTERHWGQAAAQIKGKIALQSHEGDHSGAGSHRLG